MSDRSQYTLVRDPIDGYRRLDPIPARDDLSQFYESEYYHLIRSGGRAPDIKRLLSGKHQEASREQQWLIHTLYSDVADGLVSHCTRGVHNGDGLRVLEVGCGAGLMLSWLDEQGFEVYGVEPSSDAAALATERGLEVSQGTLDSFVEAHGQLRFDAVVLINVLEHLPDPVGFLEAAGSTLADEGVLCVRVPNDFSEVQELAREKIQKDPWWIAIPDHIHYFDFGSLARLLTRLGYQVVSSQGDFPMELFLLMGLDYTNNPKQGAACHRMRVEMELSLPSAFRRSFYEALAKANIGRNCLLFAKSLSQETMSSRVLPSPQSPKRPDMSQFHQTHGEYTFVGLRQRDIQTLRQFRNAQVAVLRQKTPLSVEDQDRWYREVVKPTHRSPEPRFLLVSILDAEGTFIGYGGLTNIDWDHKRGEVSFLVSPERLGDGVLYRKDFLGFLRFLQVWSFDGLGLNKLHTETYAFRELHIRVLEEAGFRQEGRLIDHVRHHQDPNRFMDSVMHGMTASRTKETAD